MLSASALYAFFREARYRGMASAIRIPRIASTTTSSMSVKPRDRPVTALCVHANMPPYPLQPPVNALNPAPADRRETRTAGRAARPFEVQHRETALERRAPAGRAVAGQRIGRAAGRDRGWIAAGAQYLN